MFNNDVKSALLECLNENIKQEDVFLRYRLYEQVAGSTAGSTGSAPAPAGSTGTSPSPAGTTGSFPTSPVTPGGSTSTPTPMTRVTGGSKGGRGVGMKDQSSNIGYENVSDAFKDAVSALSDTGELGGVLAGINTTIAGLGLMGATGIPIVGQVYRNLLNIIPNQEALRKEGLGYTKGFAKMAD